MHPPFPCNFGPYISQVARNRVTNARTCAGSDFDALDMRKSAVRSHAESTKQIKSGYGLFCPQSRRHRLVSVASKKLSCFRLVLSCHARVLVKMRPLKLPRRRLENWPPKRRQRTLKERLARFTIETRASSRASVRRHGGPLLDTGPLAGVRLRPHAELSHNADRCRGVFLQCRDRVQQSLP